MCLIIFQLSKDVAPVSLADVERAMESNRDGAGYAYVGHAGLMVYKPFFDARDFHDAYSADHGVHGENSPFLLHFRLATRGMDDVNAHPHLVCNGQVAVAHNGILDVDLVEDESDTVSWLELVAWGRPASQLLGRRFREQMQLRIGGSKMVFLRETGDYSILNEHRGEWADGRWHSNGCVLRPPMFPLGFQRKPTVWSVRDDEMPEEDRQICLRGAERYLTRKEERQMAYAEAIDRWSWVGKDDSDDDDLDDVDLDDVQLRQIIETYSEEEE
jgi:hypothetical protein